MGATNWKWQDQNFISCKPVKAYSVQVTSDKILDTINERFLCTSTGQESELILDLVRVKGNDEEEEALRKILGMPPNMQLPDDGYMIFWK